MANQKQDDNTAAEMEQLRAQNLALHAQNDQILDGLAEMQAQVAKLSAAQVGVPAETLKQESATEALAAEWEDLKREFAGFEGLNIEVMERRVLEGVDASADIRLLDEPPQHEDPQGKKRIWWLRWFNLAKDGRAQQAASEGYVKVRWAQLRDSESLATVDRKDEFVRKGDRGMDVLYCTPLKYYLFKKKRDQLAQQGKLTSESAVRHLVANRAADAAGQAGWNADQAGSFVDTGMSITITPGTTERVTIGQ